MAKTTEPQIIATSAGLHFGQRRNPYLGLNTYSKKDKRYFFGRDTDREALIHKIDAFKITLLFAGSGVGKSSLLRASVIPKLESPTEHFYKVLYFKTWDGEEPLKLLKLTINYEFDLALSDVNEFKLKEILLMVSSINNRSTVIMLDQFEEFEHYQKLSPNYNSYIEELSMALLDKGTNVKFVISMREDFALYLNEFKRKIPRLFDNLYRLEKLDKDNARAAIGLPAKLVGHPFDEGLIDEIYSDLGKNEIENRFGFVDRADPDAENVFVDPPAIQIVCQRLWQLKVETSSRKSYIDIYKDNGRVNGILDNFFKDGIKGLDFSEKKLISKAFDRLVTPYGTKLSYSLDDLTEKISKPERDIDNTLTKLDNSRIIRKRVRGKKVWFELYHDLFSLFINKWNKAFKIELAERRIVKWTLIGALAVIFIYTIINIIVNSTSYHIQGSKLIDSHIGLYRGSGSKWWPDFTGQGGFLREIDYYTNDISMDIDAYQKRKIGMDSLYIDVSLLLDREDRLPIYLEGNNVKKKLTALSQYESDDQIRLLLAFSRTENSLNKLMSIIAQTKAEENEIEALRGDLLTSIPGFKSDTLQRTLQFIMDQNSMLPMGITAALKLYEVYPETIDTVYRYLKASSNRNKYAQFLVKNVELYGDEIDSLLEKDLITDRYIISRYLLSQNSESDRLDYLRRQNLRTSDLDYLLWRNLISVSQYVDLHGNQDHNLSIGEYLGREVGSLQRSIIDILHASINVGDYELINQMFKYASARDRDDILIPAIRRLVGRKKEDADSIFLNRFLESNKLSFDQADNLFIGDRMKYSGPFKSVKTFLQFFKDEPWFEELLLRLIKHGDFNVEPEFYLQIGPVRIDSILSMRGVDDFETLNLQVLLGKSTLVEALIEEYRREPREDNWRIRILANAIVSSGAAKGIAEMCLSKISEKGLSFEDKFRYVRLYIQIEPDYSKNTVLLEFFRQFEPEEVDGRNVRLTIYNLLEDLDFVLAEELRRKLKIQISRFFEPKHRLKEIVKGGEISNYKERFSQYYYRYMGRDLYSRLTKFDYLKVLKKLRGKIDSVEYNRAIIDINSSLGNGLEIKSVSLDSLVPSTVRANINRAVQKSDYETLNRFFQDRATLMRYYDDLIIKAIGKLDSLPGAMVDNLFNYYEEVEQDISGLFYNDLSTFKKVEQRLYQDRQRVAFILGQTLGRVAPLRCLEHVGTTKVADIRIGMISTMSLGDYDVASKALERWKSSKDILSKHDYFQIIDNFLIRREMFGDSTDIERLKNIMIMDDSGKELDNMVNERVDWTIKRLQYVSSSKHQRLKHTSEN